MSTTGTPPCSAVLHIRTTIHRCQLAAAHTEHDVFDSHESSTGYRWTTAGQIIDRPKGYRSQQRKRARQQADPDRPQPLDAEQARHLQATAGLASCSEGPYRARVVSYAPYDPTNASPERVWLQVVEWDGPRTSVCPLARVYDAAEWDAYRASDSLIGQTSYAQAYGLQHSREREGGEDAFRAAWHAAWTAAWRGAYDLDPDAAAAVWEDYHRAQIAAHAPWGMTPS